MDTRILTVLQYLNENIAEPICLEKLASIINLSSSRFSHLFRSETGDTPAHRLKTLRLEKAKALLLNTCLTVKQVRSVTGLIDKDHFRRQFKQSYGVSPQKYRNRFQHTGDLLSTPIVKEECSIAHLTYK